MFVHSIATFDDSPIEQIHLIDKKSIFSNLLMQTLEFLSEFTYLAFIFFVQKNGILETEHWVNSSLFILKVNFNILG
jgi:hypothetical protein